MSPQWCGQTIENSLGPFVKTCRGGFDFTVSFEQLVFSIIPSSIFLILLPFRVWKLCGEAPRVREGWVFGGKIVVAAIYAALQLVLLIRWTTKPPFLIRTSTAHATLSFLSSLGILLLSPLEHTCSLRPSTLLQIFLLVTFIFDVVICRTLWLVGEDGVMDWVFATGVGVKGFLFVLEVREKKGLVLNGEGKGKAEMMSGVLSLSTFWWLNSLFFIGYKKVLVLADIEGIEEAHRAKALERNIGENWAKASRTKPHALLRTLAWTLRWPLAASIFPRLCSIGFKFSQPFLIGSLIDYLDSPLKEASLGNALIGAYALAYSGVAISTSFYWYKAYRTITMVRGTLIAVIYSKTLDLALSVQPHSTPSTLMSTDAERICTCLVNLHELWANVIEVGIAVYILEKKIGIACLSPAILALACGLGTLLLTSRIGKRQDAWLKAVQRRLRATESTLSSIKGIKMMGLTEPLAKVIQDMRVKELSLAMNYRRLQITSIIISLVMNITGPAVTFTTFTIISAIRGSGTLLTAPAFTSITVLALIGTPLITLFQALPLIRSAIGSMTRIQDFLNQTDREDFRHQDELTPSKRSEACIEVEQDKTSIPMTLLKRRNSSKREKDIENLVTFSSANISWPSTDGVILHDINLTITRGSLTMVIGPVGCGKSSLLKAILREAKISEGVIDVSCGDIAFCGQIPWLTYGTIRENITGITNFPFDEAWYTTVLHACALENDLAQLPGSDRSMIGSRGIALSGGQRQRLSIARALYSRKSLAIFDDVLSGLDGNTEEQVFQRVFGPEGLVRQHGITAVLVTNKVQRLPFSSQIIAIDQSGRIAQQGDFKTLSSIDGYVLSMVFRVDAGVAAPKELVEEERSPFQPVPAGPNVSRVGDLTRQTGDFSLYKYYLKSIGFGPVCLAFGILAIYSFCLVFPTIWLDWWSTANEQRPGQNLGMYLGVYILLGVVGLVALTLFCWQMIIVMAPRAGRKLHSTVLQHALWAPMSYLNRTDMGTIMNRFTQDMQLVDFQVTLTSMSAAEAFSTTIFRLLVVCITAKYVASIIPLSLGVVYIIQKGYLRTSRQLRHLDLEAKAPIYSLFSETADGLATIRAFGCQDLFRRRNHMLLDGAQKPFHLLNCIQRWLGFVLDMLLTVVSVLVVVFAVKFEKKTSAGSTGVALINVLTCHQHLAGFVQRWTLLETSIGAVSRVRAFALECPVESRQGTVQPPPSWPSGGSIEVENISASYIHNSPVLRNVTCSIQPGSKIGVCGRTGSGKSSFILSLLQILDTSTGKIIIDGLDLSHLPQDVVRSAFTTVPQDAVLFEGSIRFNLDPRGVASDGEIGDVLRKVRLWDIILSLGSGLGVPIDSIHLSHGQRQLFALGRAMLSTARILILDEAVSSVDRETNRLMQELVRSEFAGRTVICVDHHLENILDYDKIAVFDGGALVEFDKPGELLRRRSRFRQMVEA